jgi:hypothetical protein
MPDRHGGVRQRRTGAVSSATGDDRVTGASYPELGRSFGGRHRTTVMTAVAPMERRRSKDMKIDALIKRVSDALGVTFHEVRRSDLLPGSRLQRASEDR